MESLPSAALAREAPRLELLGVAAVGGAEAAAAVAAARAASTELGREEFKE
jgi:hypothetical protein